MLKSLVVQLNRLIVAVLIGAITLYQWVLSPLIGRQCRFAPTCSHYAKQAVLHHGALTGCVLAGIRICRCNPFGGSGHDPIPATFAWTDLIPSFLIKTRSPDGSQT
jgi:putative membrane protein insertion efficiency factor